MVKGIILDVDGVIVGEKIGFNSPWPHPEVIKKLKDIKSKGVFISLSTAKPHFAIDKIINDAGLDNLHITDGGGVIIDPIDKEIIKKHTIEKLTAKKLISNYIEAGIYTEFYTVDDYFIQKNQVSKITRQHTHILQKKPKIVGSLTTKSLSQEITKLMPIAEDEKDKERLTQLFDPFKNKLTLSWGVHPVALPLQFGIVTAPGISKKNGAIDISESEHISFNNIVGVGDSESDWQFIQLCKYAGAVGNASDELKELVQSKKDSYIGPGVDENGIINILDHFI